LETVQSVIFLRDGDDYSIVARVRDTHCLFDSAPTVITDPEPESPKVSETWTVNALKAFAKENGIKVPSKIKKKIDIVNFLMSN
jgi:hypothetical protein